MHPCRVLLYLNTRNLLRICIFIAIIRRKILILEQDMKNLFKISFALLVLLLALCAPVTVGAIQESPVQDSPPHL